MFFVNVIDDVGCRCLDSISAVSVVEYGYVETFFPDEERIELFTFYSVPVSTCIGYGKGVDLCDGSFQSCLAAIQTMIVCCEKNVESGIFDSLQIFVGCTESRIALIRFSTESRFKIT